MYCTTCGNENDKDSKFCTKCGNVISTDNLDSDIKSPAKIPNKLSPDKTKKINKIYFKKIKIPKSIIIVFGLLIILGAVIISIPGSYNKNNDHNVENTTVGTNSTETGDVQNDIQNLKTDNTVKVSIDSTPTGAGIYIDNIFKGNTPKTINLDVGNYNLKLNMTGYKSIRTELNITSDMARQEVTATLEPSG